MHMPLNLNGLFAAEGNDSEESQIEGVETEFDRTEPVSGGGIEDEVIKHHLEQEEDARHTVCDSVGM